METKEPRPGVRPAHSATPDAQARPKRAYVSPALIEYGSVGKLTQAGSGTYAEVSKTMMTMTCL